MSRCGDCRYARPLAGPHRIECHRRAPVARAGLDPAQAYPWPRLHVDDWCGEFEPIRVAFGPLVALDFVIRQTPTPPQDAPTDLDTMASWMANHGFVIPDPPFLTMGRVSVGELSLSTRARNIVRAMGITDLAQIEGISRSDWHRVPGVGPKTAEELTEVGPTYRADFADCQAPRRS